MTPACTRCAHSKITYVMGRERVGCHRSRILPDGKTLSPPRNGWEAAIERLPQVQVDWRAKDDKCGPEARHFKQSS